MKRSSLVVVVIILAWYSVAPAGTLTFRPHKTFDSIQMLIDMASPGDTVLVPRGEYHVSLLMKDAITLLGEKGWLYTKLLPIAGMRKPIISCIDLEGGVVISGFTLKGGEAEKGAGIYCLRSMVTISDNRFHRSGAMHYWWEGGAIYCLRSYVTIVDNRFHECGALYGGCIYCGPETEGIIADNEFKGWDATLGGAILCLSACPLIQNNTFTNMDRDDGGAICCTGDATPYIRWNQISNCRDFDDGSGILCLVSSSPVIEGNTISECWAEHGGAICAKEQSSPLLIANDIVDNLAWYSGGGVACLNSASVSIIDSQIRRNISRRVGGGVSCHSESTVEIAQSVITNNLSGSEGAGLHVGGDNQVTCTGCTFWGNEPSGTGSCIEVRGTSTLEVSNCIVAHTRNGAGISRLEGAAVTSDCNDLWANGTSYQGCVAGPNDFAEKPLFCFPTSFGLDASSPCIDHPVCGMVGALGIECGATLSSSRAESTTWGAIKSMYR